MWYPLGNINLFYPAPQYDDSLHIKDMLDEFLSFFIAAPDQPVEPTTSNKGKGKKRKRKTPSEGPDQPVPATTGRRKKRKQDTSCVGPKKPRHCSLCKNHTKGHKNVKNCPRNKKK